MDVKLKLSEMEQKCEKLNSTKGQLETKESELQKLETKAVEAKEDYKIRKMLAEIKGETYEEEFKLEQLDKIRAEKTELESDVEQQEKAIFEGMKQLALDAITSNIPEVDPERKIILGFEGKSFENSMSFIASILNSKLPLKLDNILAYSDKIVVTHVTQRIEAVEALKTFLENVKRLARVALKKNDPDVEATAKYLYEGPYREVWETIDGRETSLQRIYSKLNITDHNEMKKVQNFFTNTKIVLKDNYPFVSIGKGSYELNFFGAMVWTSYQNTFLKKEKVESFEDKSTVASEEENTKKENATRKDENSTLNGFFSDKDIQDTLYRTKNSGEKMK